MIEDLRSLEDGVTVEADLVVIGAGVAGITMARELAGSSLSVCIAEGGGLEAEAESQALYEGSVSGIPYFPLDIARLRFFGGSSNHWNNRCTRFTEVDFAVRPWMPHSGWPIDAASMQPYYERAHPYATLGPYEYDPERVEPFADRRITGGMDGIEEVVFHDTVEPTRFGQVYREAVESAPNVRVVLHANLIRLQASADAERIEHAQVRTLEGNRAKLKARRFVLAAGGMENPRLLLLPNDVAANGLGNDHDLVGRFFGEHRHGLAATGVSLGDQGWREAYRYLPHGQGVLLRELQLTQAFEEQRGLNHINWRLKFHGVPELTGFEALRAMVRGVLGRAPRVDFATNTRAFITDIDDVLTGLYGYARDGFYTRPLVSDNENPFTIEFDCEMAPNPDSRIMLGLERDILGLNRIVLDLRPSPIDVETIRIGTQKLAAELLRAGIARVQMPTWLAEGTLEWDPDGFGYHHMGTTRMSDDPRRGVVDANCRVHGLANLYVAGSSVFPTGGAVVPTLSVIAFTIRLADHLKAISSS